MLRTWAVGVRADAAPAASSQDGSCPLLRDTLISAFESTLLALWFPFHNNGTPRNFSIIIWYFVCKSGQSGHLCILGKDPLGFQERRVGHQCHHLGKLDGKLDFQYFHLSDESDGFVAHCMSVSYVRLDHRWERLLHTLVFKLSPSDSNNIGWNIGELDGWTDMMIIRDRGIIRHEKSETIPFGL